MGGFESISKYKESYRGVKNFNNILFDTFVKENNIVSCCRGFSTQNMYKTLNKQRITKGDYEHNADESPFRDHQSAFKTKEETVIYTYQPYLAVDISSHENYRGYLEKILKCYTEVNTWCAERNIKF